MMAVESKPSGDFKKRTRSVGTLVLALVATLAVILIVVWGLASNLSTVADKVSTVAEDLSIAADDVAGSINVFDDAAINARQFVSVQADIVLRPIDFSNEYRILTGDEVRRANSTIVSEMGQLAGKGYIQETGRVDGWQTRLERISSSTFGPAVYQSTVEVFETTDGAALALSPQYFWAYTDQDRTPTEFLDRNCSIGTDCIFFLFDDFDPVTSLTTLSYEVAFRVGNVVTWVSASGLDFEVTEQHALDAAEILFTRLSSLQ